MKKLYQILETSLLFQKLVLALFLFLSIMAVEEGFQNGLYFSSIGWQIFSWVNIGVAGCLAVIFSLLLLKKDLPLRNGIKKIMSGIRISRFLTILFFVLIVIAYVYLIFIKFASFFDGFYLRTYTLFLVACILAIMLKTHYKGNSFNLIFLFSLLILACAYQVGNYFSDISSNPFSLAWSEGSRYYYASLVFSEKIYGQDIPLSFLHPSRYLILSLPYLIPGAGIFIHRAWQVFLWVMTTGICMVALVRRLKLPGFWWNAILTLSGFLFLQQAPVYYHLLISAIIILIGFNKDKPWQSILMVILASAWAGISRINWYPLPGVLAATLYFFENPKTEDTTVWEYGKQPVLYIVLGLIVSFLANLLYVPLSGNSNIENFTTSFTSSLLWDRLLPGPTFEKGILTGILWLCAPLLVLLVIRLIDLKKMFGRVQRLFLFLALSVFFLGGLAVSVKIGGGSNLHNMDAFMLLLLTAVYYLWFSNFYQQPSQKCSSPIWVLLCLVMLLQPLFWGLSVWSPRINFSGESLQHDLAEINGYIESVNNQKPENEILFINQRQLLTFGYVPDTDLVADYELLELMEMAISGQDAYLQEFYADLASHRFDLIIVNKQYLLFKEKDKAFSEENNAWVKNITIPLMEYYTPAAWLRYTDSEIYVPRSAND